VRREDRGDGLSADGLPVKDGGDAFLAAKLVLRVDRAAFLRATK